MGEEYNATIGMKNCGRTELTPNTKDDILIMANDFDLDKANKDIIQHI